MNTGKTLSITVIVSPPSWRFCVCVCVCGGGGANTLDNILSPHSLVGGVELRFFLPWFPVQQKHDVEMGNIKVM